MTANASRPSLGSSNVSPAKRSPDEDREDPARVHEGDRRSGGVRTSSLGGREDHGKRQAGREPEHERAGDGKPERTVEREQGRTGGCSDQREATRFRPPTRWAISPP